MIWPNSTDPNASTYTSDANNIAGVTNRNAFDVSTTASRTQLNGGVKITRGTVNANRAISVAESSDR